MPIDIPRLLSSLALKRPVFHSEADLQHELAFHVREVHHDVQVRLEYPVNLHGNVSVDILIRKEGKEIAIELKYLCRQFECKISGEHFLLQQQSAHNIRRYDVLKDVWRMENYLTARPAASAAVIVLSNDPLYWLGPLREGTSGAAFSLRQDRMVTGNMRWADHAAAGTMRGREEIISLGGRYEMKWQDYSIIDGRYGEFRFLYIQAQLG